MSDEKEVPRIKCNSCNDSGLCGDCDGPENEVPSDIPYAALVALDKLKADWQAEKKALEDQLTELKKMIPFYVVGGDLWKTCIVNNSKITRLKAELEKVRWENRTLKEALEAYEGRRV